MNDSASWSIVRLLLANARLTAKFASRSRSRRFVSGAECSKKNVLLVRFFENGHLLDLTVLARFSMRVLKSAIDVSWENLERCGL